MRFKQDRHEKWVRVYCCQTEIQWKHFRRNGAINSIVSRWRILFMLLFINQMEPFRSWWRTWPQNKTFCPLTLEVNGHLSWTGPVTDREVCTMLLDICQIDNKRSMKSIQPNSYCVLFLWTIQGNTAPVSRRSRKGGATVHQIVLPSRNLSLCVLVSLQKC